MVAAKYLRRAPHPDTWDEHAEALLKSLGGDKSKRRKFLKDTLASLDTEKLVRKIPRPGRKTNAENAIAFYRHVLALNEGEVESEEEEEEEEESSEKEAEPKQRKQRTALPRRTDDDGSQTGAASVASMDSEEFAKLHNDVCEVCSDGGELVCCSTCNLVFHLHCIRPPTTRFPPDKWCCAFCVAAGVRGHTKEARTRRRAAAAAREMTRMKNELNPEESSESNEASGDKKEPAQRKRRGRPPRRAVEPETKDEEEPAKKRRGRPTRHSVEPEARGEAKEAEKQEEEPVKKRRGRLPKRPVEAEATKEAEEEPEAKKAKLEDDAQDEVAAEGRSSPRRERRQPALYNPQAGPARKWQSDGKREWRSLGSDDDASKGTDDDTDTSEKDVWCSFCGDDPTIMVCCFCACRVCFGKHDKSKLLICDNCEDEYHIHCLDPPLKSVPHTKKWFCSTCKVAMEEAKPSPESTAGPKRRGPGRPPKKAPPPIEDIPVLPKRRGRPPKKLTEDLEEEDSPVVKKRPGRPPKKKAAPTARKTKPAARKAKSSPDTPVRSNVGKKRRGRPPKNKNAQDGNKGTTSLPSRVEVPKMPLVTPRSAQGLSNAAAAAAAATRMQSVPGVATASSVSTGNNPQVAATVPQKSRSGRTFKRTPFHDEIPEGPQMGQPLKSATDKGAAQSATGQAVSQTAPSYQAFLQPQRNVPVPNLAMAQMSKPPASIRGSAPLMQAMNAPGAVRVGTQTGASFAAPAGAMRPPTLYNPAGIATTKGPLPVPPAVLAYPSAPVAHAPPPAAAASSSSKQGPRRKPGARECMQLSRKFGVKVIPQQYVDTLMDYCSRGKVDHLVRMRERLDEHSRLLESQLAGLEALVKEKGELDIAVPAAEFRADRSPPG